MKKKRNRMLWHAAVAVWFLLLVSGDTQVSAEKMPEQNAFEGEMMQLCEDADLYEAAMEDAEKVVRLPAQSPVFVVGQQGEWATLFYGGRILYLKAEALGTADEQTALKEEMESWKEEQAQEMENYLDEQEAEERDRRMKLFLFSGIVLLFAVGIGGTLCQERKELRSKRKRRRKKRKVSRKGRKSL